MSPILVAICLIAIPGEASQGHWAYRPVRTPAPPIVRDTDWPQGSIDRFILARLEAAGLKPSPRADRRTLLRRAYYDLIGLPPPPAAVERFERDASPDAFARVVDELLASPHYGERWGRHWLDVARYADTKDLVLVLGRDAIRPYAYTYRDYVIRALNSDLSYDRFLHQQLAADQIRPRVEPWQLAAMGFLTLGRLFDNNPHDIYDDQIDVVSRGLLGLTVSCARCHDHKYDAISMADYYSLYGIFASSERPLERPLIGDSPAPRACEAFERRIAPKRKELRDHVDTQYAGITETARTRVSDYLVEIATQKPDPLETAIFFMSLSPDQLKPKIIASWRRYVASRARRDDPVFGPWSRLLALPPARLAAEAPGIVESLESMPAGTATGQLNPLVVQALSTAKLATRADVARAYGKLLRRVYDESKSRRAEDMTDAARQLLDVLVGKQSPIHFPKTNTYLYMARVDRSKYHKLLLDLDKLAVNDASAPPRAMILTDAAELYEPRIFTRGDPARPGAKVTRRFLSVLSNAGSTPFTHGSGRLDLAHAITASDNPLAGRVMVNRVWLHHFGEPIVSTPSDFGVRSAPPLHADLLDYLARTFVNDGWSLKSLHRSILLSSTYQQASRERPECSAVDPANRLLWRANRRRLELEPMRDTVLALSGRLDRTFFGRPVDVAGDPRNRRRTIYGLVDRQNLPGLFRAFDFASPDQSAPRRPRTTVPQQALFAMNSTFMLEGARGLTARTEVAGAVDARRRIEALYRLLFAREPDADELEAGLTYTQKARAAQANDEETKLTPWEQYAQVLLLTNELLFVD